MASMLVVTGGDEASACSCYALQPAEAVAEFDAAFVGRMVDRPTSGMPFTEEAEYRFEVDEWVKGGLGSDLVVFAPNQGSACGFEVPLGERVGVLLTVVNGKAKGNLCTTVDADLLLAGEQPLALDGSGPPVFLIAGYGGAARLMVLDAGGGLLATVGDEEGSLNGLALCPGGVLLVELVNDQLVVRSTSDLSEIRRVGTDDLPYRVAVPQIWCRDSGGQTIWVAADEWTEETGTIYRLLRADDLEQPILEGNFGWLDLGNDYAVAGEGPTGETIWRIHLETGERTVLHEIPVEMGDAPPSGLGWVDPAGERVLIAQWRYRDDSGGHTMLFLYGLDDGDLLWRSKTLPTADGVGWIDDTRFLAESWPDMNSEIPESLLIDTAAFEISVVDRSPGWQSYRVGDWLASVTRGAPSGHTVGRWRCHRAAPPALRQPPSRRCARPRGHPHGVTTPVVTQATERAPAASEPAPRDTAATRVAISTDPESTLVPSLALLAAGTIALGLTGATLWRVRSRR